MRNGFLTGCASVLLLAGCGGDTGGTAPSRGVLQGGILGVTYSTPTRSGVTDANGTFEYAAGETVSFSIGGVPLGSAAGAGNITLFTLCGLAPPTTESALRRALQIGMSKPTAFTRAVNLARFFVALDADGNPANGIDVRGRGTLLANANIDFDAGVLEFARRLEREVPELTRGLAYEIAVAELYRLSGITVPVHALTRIEITGAMLPGSPYTQLRTYDAAGNIESNSVDSDGDGTADVRFRYTHDALGRQLTFTGDRDQPFIYLERHLSSRSTFSARGDLLSMADEYDIEADGVIDLRNFAEYGYDRFGNATSGTVRRDNNGDGVIDVVETTVATFNARNLGESSVWTADDDANGSIDARSVERATYDAQDRLLTSRYEFDSDADGVMDGGSSYRLEYAVSGRTKRTVYESDSDLDGDVDERYVLEYEYDAAGNLIHSQSEGDYDGDGVIDWSDSVTLTYDADGRELGNVRVWDAVGDGINEPRIETQHEYDAAGNRRVTVQRTIYPGEQAGPGVNIGVATTRTEYGADGEFLASTTGYDFDGDRIPEQVDTTTAATYSIMSDGVLLLAHEYFTGGALNPQMIY